MDRPGKETPASVSSLAASARHVLDADRALGAYGALAAGERVEVYRNLHHGKGPRHFWSVRSSRTHKVLGVFAHVDLEDAVLRVQRAAWAKVLATGRRTVHAYAAGTVRAWGEDVAPRRPRGLLRFTYNPERGPYFHLADLDNPTPVESARRMWFDIDGAWMEVA